MEGIVDVIDAFVCPITGEVLLDPVLAADGHTYSRAAIAKWFERRQTSPLTGAQLPTTQLLPNHAMRKAIEETRGRQPLAIEPGRLQIHEDQVLGEGSHGRVVEGTLSLGPQRTVRVAVKMLPGLTQSEERTSFQRELRPHMLAARHCDGVCRLYGTCELPGLRMALVMKRYETSLRKMISAADGPLEAATVCRLGHCLAKTLAQLAAAGIVCRDIKSDNILLDEYGDPVLADFGISVVLSTATHIAPTTIQGTFNYMSPEALNDQAEGGIGPHTDVWSLACVIVEMLTGKMPWAGMPIQQIIMAVAMQFRVPTVPDGAPAVDVLRRCFAKAPHDRPTAAQLAEALAPASVAPAPPPSQEARESAEILQQTMDANAGLTEQVKTLFDEKKSTDAALRESNARVKALLDEKEGADAALRESNARIRSLLEEKEGAHAAFQKESANAERKWRKLKASDERWYRQVFATDSPRFSRQFFANDAFRYLLFTSEKLRQRDNELTVCKTERDSQAAVAAGAVAAHLDAEAGSVREVEKQRRTKALLDATFEKLKQRTKELTVCKMERDSLVEQLEKQKPVLPQRPAKAVEGRSYCAGGALDSASNGGPCLRAPSQPCEDTAPDAKYFGGPPVSAQVNMCASGEDGHNDDADHFRCAISLDIMKDPVRTLRLFSPQ